MVEPGGHGMERAKAAAYAFEYRLRHGLPTEGRKARAAGRAPMLPDARYIDW
jgi:hypothetical protein